jgi:hypothetical protein
MAVNLDVLLQSPIFDFWAVPVTFVPRKSQQTTGSYPGRGILNTYSVDVTALDGSIYSDQRTILDIRESEFSILPMQNDLLIIEQDCNGVARGTWQIVDAVSDGGGQTMLTIRKYETMMR